MALEKDRLVDITTIGRKSGKPHRIEIGFHYFEPDLYISGSPGKRDWYANLLANPDFMMHFKQSAQIDVPAEAKPITEEAERRVVLEKIVARWNRLDKLHVFVARSPLVEVTLEGNGGPHSGSTRTMSPDSQLAQGEFDVELNNIRIHYTVRGSGPPLISHSGGPGMDARTWDDFAGIDKFVTVIALHPRGSGLSGAAPDGAYTLPDYAADMEALRQHLGLEQPLIIGWSHGGMVAQQFAFTYPDSLSKLILMDTAAYVGDFLEDVEAAVAGFKDKPWYEESLAALKQEWDGDYETGEDMAALWADEMKFYFARFDGRAAEYHARTKDLPIQIEPLRQFNEYEFGTMDLRPQLGDISVPTLIIVGRHDFITNVAMAEELQKHIPNARLEIFEESGHFTLIEEREKFYAAVNQFALSS